MSSSDQKLDEIIQRLGRIEKALNIIPDKDGMIKDFQSSVSDYVKFAKERLKLGKTTIDNQKSAICGFLSHCNGIVTKETVKSYLDSNESESWRSNQIKALRRYIRDFLKLGNWINEFEFSKTKAKAKQVPSDDELIEFFNALPSIQYKLVFLILHNSGLRIGEVLQLKLRNIDFEINMINASDLHKGATKHSWISFITKQTIDLFSQYISHQGITSQDSKLFTISERSVQKEFEDTSTWREIKIRPHLLRTVFTDRCTKAGILDKYIDAFCGRVPQGVLAKHYTDYSPSRLRQVYDKAEPYLVLGKRTVLTNTQ